jgi:hypothetical protein
MVLSGACSSTFNFSAVFGVPAIGQTQAAYVWADGMGNVYVARQDTTGAQGVLLRTADNGNSWGQSTVAQTMRFTGVWGSAANDVYVVGDNVILHATDGQHFTSIPGSNGYPWRAVSGLGPNQVYFVEPAGVWTVTLAGVLARVLSVPGATSVWPADASHFYVATDRGQLLRSDAPAPIQVSSAALWFVGGSGANDVFAGGAGGQLFHESGASWLALPSAERDLRAIWGASNGAVYLVGDAGVYFTANGGRSLVHDSSPTGTSIIGTPGGELWMVGGGMVYHGTR